ncbi:MAG: cupredoxin domain-containing protein [Desulfuromonadaceae bacterium]
MKLNCIIAVLSITVFASMAGASDKHAGDHGSGDVIGQAGNPEKVTRTISIDMSDAMRFTPATITVKQGETIRFVVRNSGKIPHEMVLGTEKDLMEHYEAMKKHPEMEHADDNMVTVQPGKTGEIIWHFTKAGSVSFACLLPGHYEAGMKGAVKVKAGTRKRSDKK